MCIQKDLNELNLWINTLEFFNNELDHFSVIEKQLIKKASVSSTIQAIRRKNVLNMAILCKYEQELKTEYQYGKTEYDLNRLRFHEQKRISYMKLVDECNTFKNKFYLSLRKYRRE
ncbi:hypothetical protein KO504_13000 [Winogradskyella psychrotolerans]|uniref:hypothetical protein n=1 Tax=Winogradskyella TaxID=286104 RepID=UPI001C06A35B|nr:hypothetical protein [Winogradskyella psychrotolerans]MBU2922263.1 hypothetical protein [Winogradskyella psychrotolerans]